MKKLIKIFNIRTFIIVLVIIFLLVFLVMFVVDKYNQYMFEKKKQEAIDNMLSAYTNGKTAKLDDYIEHCGWEESDISSVVLGIDADGLGLSKYYIDDEKIIKKILKEFKNVEYIGANDNAYDELGSRIWTLQFINDKEIYSMYFTGYDTDYKGMEMLKATTCYVDFSSSSNVSFPHFVDITGVWIFLKDGGLYDAIYSIYKENIRKITVSEIKDLKERNSTELTDYFIYVHKFTEAPNFVDETGELRVTNVFSFPIEGTDSYMEVEKYNEYGDGYNSEYTHLEIIRVEIFNKAGEGIDLFECTDEELDKYLYK